MQLKVLSWNIWLNGDYAKTIEFLASADADIIGLQEVIPGNPEGDVYEYMTKELGYRGVYAPSMDIQKRGTMMQMGNAVFTKYPIIANTTHVLSNINPRVAIQADIKVAGVKLHVFSTHLLHAHLQPSVLQDKQAENLLKLLPTKRTIVMGDFNATPQTTAIRMASEQLAYTGNGAPTWSVYPEACCKFEGVVHLLDYIFVTKDIRFHSSKVESSSASDHLPISTIIEL